MLQVVCKDEAIALALVAVYDDRGEEVGDALLARLQAKGACEWRTISGRPIADLYPGKNVPSPRLVGGQYVLQRHALKVDVITPEGVPEAPPAYMLMTYVSAPEA